MDGFTVSVMVVDPVVVPETPLIVTVEVPVVAVLVAVNVAMLVPVVGLVLQETLTPLGNVEVDKVTLPVKPPVSVTVIVSVAVAPCVTLTDVGDAANVKPDVGLAATVSAMGVVSVVEPETPLMVTVELPVVAVLVAVNVATLVPVVGLVLQETLTPLGRVEVDNVTLPVKPPVSVTVIVSVAVAPCVTLTDVGDADSVKPLVVDGFTVSVIGVDAVVEPLVPVMVTVDAPVVAVLVAVNVATLLPVVGLVLQETLMPLGSVDVDKVTLPVKPPTSVTVIVSVAVPPCVTVTDVGDAPSVKPDVPVMSVRVAECVTEPSVPTIEILVLPAGVLVCDVKFTVAVPLAFSEDGLKLAVTPEGRFVALNETLPVNPPTKVTVMVAVGLVLGGRLSEVGETEIVKFGSAVTVKVRFAVSVMAEDPEPETPVIVTVAAPTVAVFVATSVSVLPAEPVTEAGLKVAVTPEGRPLMVRATALSKPFTAVTVTPSVTVVPCSMLTAAAEMLKPGAVVVAIGG